MSAEYRSSDASPRIGGRRHLGLGRRDQKGVQIINRLKGFIHALKSIRNRLGEETKQQLVTGWAQIARAGWEVPRRRERAGQPARKDCPK